jgi:putative spermidine/putrescine transport system substrate-binding protein
MRGAAPVVSSLLVAFACSGQPDGVETVLVHEEIGEAEGIVSLLAFAGYAEDGSSDPRFDWVHPFQRQTGCAVEVRYVDSGEEVARLLTRADAGFDGATVPGDTAGELISTGAVAAVDPALFPAWPQVLAPLRNDGRHFISDGKVFGVPALYGPNFLLYQSKVVAPAPTSWDVVFEPDTPYAGRIAMLDSPMAIADAALYLATRSPELGIRDPYALTPAQLDAAAALLDDQEDRVALYWSLFTDLVEAFGEGRTAVGAGWPIALSLLEIDDVPVAAAEPVEGMTGWADTWMISAHAPHPDCMLRWMRWTLNANVQADTAIWYGGAPSNLRACTVIERELGEIVDPAVDLRFGRCGDREFLGGLALWRMPTVDCGDGRGRACTGLSAWQRRWRSIRD